jgi:hypothetical protein
MSAHKKGSKSHPQNLRVSVPHTPRCLALQASLIIPPKEESLQLCELCALGVRHNNRADNLSLPHAKFFAAEPRQTRNGFAVIIKMAGSSPPSGEPLRQPTERFFQKNTHIISYRGSESKWGFEVA